MAKLCAHGYRSGTCSICDHAPGECDFGSCQEPATGYAELREGDRVVERRPMCERHGTKYHAGEWHTGPIPGREDGGPVEAGEPYTVGEAGEETFVPEVDGVIVPNPVAVIEAQTRGDVARIEAAAAAEIAVMEAEQEAAAPEAGELTEAGDAGDLLPPPAPESDHWYTRPLWPARKGA